MEKKSFFDKIKVFYQSKRGRAICFFSFYLIFFFVLDIYLKQQQNVIKDEHKEEKTNIISNNKSNNDSFFDISKIINSNYEYLYTINDNNKIINYQGKRLNVDYLNFENNYFLDIYNVNQLIKKSKVISKEKNVLHYELTNSVLNELLLTNKPEGLSMIDVYINDNKEVEKIVMDLKNYFEKEIYEITLEYKVGEL